MYDSPYGKLIGILVFWGFAIKSIVSIVLGLHDGSHRGDLYVGVAGLLLLIVVAVRQIFFKKSK
jgi:hypothetical protein